MIMFQPEDCYPMKNSHRGSALIFVNTIQRIGAKQEIYHLKFIAELMGLKPFVYLDLTSTQVVNILESITNPGKHVDLRNIQPTPPKLFKDDDMIFIAFSTHGFEEGLRFSDRKDLKYSCLKNFFNIDNCPVLIGKPKIILFNSCRSTEVIFDKSYFTPKVLHNQIETDCFTKNSTDYDVHTTNSDIIVIHSTNFGTVSIRLDDRGSLAIEQIRLTFEKFSNSRLTFESILSRANRELIMTTDTETKEHAEERKIHRIGQCMEWDVTLKYDLIIPPFDSPIAIQIDNYNKEVIDLTDAESLFEDLNIANVLAAHSNLYNKFLLTTYVNSASDEDKEFTASASDGDEEITANICNKVSNSASDGDEEFTSNASDCDEEITVNESDGNEEITANAYNNMSNCASDEDKEFTASASDGDEEITANGYNIMSNCASDEDKEIASKFSNKSAHFRNPCYGVWRFKNPQLQQRQNFPSSRNKVYNNEIVGTPTRVSHTSKNITSKYVRENNYTHCSTYKHLQQWLDFPNGNQAISQTNSMTINHSPCETYNHQLNLGRSPFEYSLQVKNSVNAKRTENKIIMYDNSRNSNKKLELNRSASELDGSQRKKRKY